MNWKLRFKNKATLAALIAAAASFVYQILGILGITPAISQSAITSAAGALLSMLTIMGVLVDPTTEGICDSERALGYTSPAKSGCGEYENEGEHLDV